MADDKKLTTRAADFSAWYNEVVLRAELADYSPVRGCMVIRPERLRHLGADAARARRHVQGDRAPERVLPAVHSRELPAQGGRARRGLRARGGGRHARRRQEARGAAVVRPDVGDDHLRDVREVGAELSRPADSHQPVGERRALGDAHAALPAHARVPLAGRAHRARHARRGRGGGATMLGVYRDFMEGWMAMPVVTGQKTDSERFAGALRTYSCEAMMQDNKALQAGTSHNLGQNFAKAFDLKFQTESGGDGVRLEHELGRVDAPGRRARHDARRRQRPARRRRCSRPSSS